MGTANLYVNLWEFEDEIYMFYGGNKWQFYNIFLHFFVIFILTNIFAI
jgi:hypothetical protein